MLKVIPGMTNNVFNFSVVHFNNADPPMTKIPQQVIGMELIIIPNSLPKSSPRVVTSTDSD